MERNLKNNFLLYCVALLVCIGFFIPVFSGVPERALAANQFARQIEISAYIVNKKNVEFANGQYDVRFAIYTSDRSGLGSAEGTAIWQESQQVEIKNGVFSIYLGSAVPLPEDIDFSQESYYLGVKIGADSEMVPRKKIGSVSLAINALNAASLSGAVIGEEEGNIPVLGNGGTFNEALLPEITSLGTVSTGAWEADPIGLAYGGTGSSAVGIAGAVAYSDGIKYAFTEQGAAGQVLVSGGTGAPTWGSVSGGLITNDSLNFTELADNLTLDNDTTIDTNGFDFNIDGTLQADSLIISGQATIGTLGLNLYTNTSFIPSTDGLNLGSSSNHWANIYVDNLSVGGTDVNGTTSEFFSINSDSTSEEDMGLRFYRSALNGYAALVWDSLNSKFNLYKRENTAEYANLALNTISATGAGNNYFAGNVGIGIATPSAKLDIYQGNLDLDNTTNANQYGVILKNGTRFIHNFNYGNNGTVTTAGYNTFVGQEAGNLTMGSTATSASHSSYNTAVGYRSLYSNTTGYENVANGPFSLSLNTTGYSNTANGYASLYNTSTGYFNTANGYRSLYLNTTGNQNVASGAYSLYSNTTGSENTANGYYSLQANTIGYQNTAIGDGALYSSTTGNNNTALGLYAGRYIANGATGNTTGDYNTFLGFNTKALADNDQNEIVIGYNATGIGSNSVVLGNDSITNTALKGNVGIGTTSPGVKLAVNGVVSGTQFYKYLGAGGSYLDMSDLNVTINAYEGGGSYFYIKNRNAAAALINKISVPNGSDVAAIFTGNVGIGDTTPASLFTIGNGDLFQINSSGQVVAGTWQGTAIGVQYGGTGTATQFTQGSIVFAGASGVYSQDNTNFFWDDTDNQLGLGTASPNSKLDILDTAVTTGSILALGQNTSAFSGDGINMNFANSSGTFTGDFLDFNVNSVNSFRVDHRGTVRITPQGGYYGIYLTQNGDDDGGRFRMLANDINQQNSYALQLYVNNDIDLFNTAGAIEVREYGAVGTSATTNTFNVLHAGSDKASDLFYANMANGTGSFTGDFLDFNVNSGNLFRMDYHGKSIATPTNGYEGFEVNQYWDSRAFHAVMDARDMAQEGYYAYYADINNDADAFATGGGLYIEETGDASTALTSDTIVVNHSVTSKDSDLFHANMANGSGSFAGDFLDFNVNSVQQFAVNAGGFIVTQGGLGVYGGGINLVNSNQLAIGPGTSFRLWDDGSKSYIMTNDDTARDLEITTGTSNKVTMDGGLTIGNGLIINNIDNNPLTINNVANNDSINIHDTSSTSGNRMIDILHDTSANSSDMIVARMANGSGSFTGDFLDFNVNSVNKFKLDANGNVNLVGDITAGDQAVTGWTDYGYMEILTDYATDTSNHYTALQVRDSETSGPKGGSFVGLRARGTAVAPSAVLADDMLATFAARGYDGTDWNTTGVSRAGVEMHAASNWSNTDNGAYISFNTTATTSTIAAERMRIGHDGTITFSALADGSLSIVGGVVTSSSDERKKDKVGDIDSVLEKVLKLDPLIYTWKDSTPEGQAAPNKEQIGFFAQDMEQYFPQLVGENKEGMKGLNYNGYTAVLTKAIQEQQASIGAISNDQLSISNEFSMINDQISIDGGKITNLETLVQTLEAQVAELQAQIATPVNVAQIDLNTQDISFIKTLLGIDPANPTNITLAGQLTAEGIKTGKLTIKIIDPESPTIGAEVIKAGDIEITVPTKAVTGDSKIFVAPMTNDPVAWAISGKKAGESFTIKLGSPSESDISFDWWIVEKGN